MKLASALLLGSLMSACALEGASDPSGDPEAPGDDASSTDDGFLKEAFETLGSASGLASGKATALPITYHGGPVMLGTSKVYLLWYGSWTGNTALTLVPAFTQALGGSPYFNINTTYGNASGVKVSNALALGGQATDAYSRGKALGDADVAMVVSAAITAKKLPKDPNGIYVVLSSADVNETSGMCTKYCGWHTYMTLGGTPTRMAYIGNPDRCPTACEAQTGRSPNANPGADGLISVLAHEISETVTDPNLNAWYDQQGAENADKCAWTFGTTYGVANGSRANVKLGGRHYLIQQNWLNLGAGACAMAR